jgi:hypothetical protein
MRFEQAFGELRSLLSQAPSELLWEQLCALCDAAVAVDAARFEAEVLPYVSDGLEGWPDALRRLQASWVDAIVKEGWHPCGPLVRRLDRHLTHDAARLLAAPCLAQVTEVSLFGISVARLDALEGASMLGSLRVLTLGGADPKGAHKVFRSAAALKELHAGSCSREEGAQLLKALRTSKWLAQLEVLTMGGEGFGAAQAAGLGACVRLRELGVWSNPAFGDAGVAALCEALHDAPLERLTVGRCGVTEVEVIAQARWRLERLSIWGNALSGQALRRLGAHEAFSALRQLDVSNMLLRGGVLAPLLSRRGAQPLRELRCERLPELSEVSWRAAARGETARGLEVLSAGGARLSAGGALEGLVAGMDDGRMRQLLLPGCGLEAAHMATLRDARLPDLRELDLCDNRIGDAGLQVLLEARWVEGLETLKVSGCGLSVATVKMLREQAPRLGALRTLYLGVSDIWSDQERIPFLAALPQVKIQLGRRR